jgi:hypothetical protein
MHEVGFWMTQAESPFAVFPILSHINKNIVLLLRLGRDYGKLVFKFFFHVSKTLKRHGFFTRDATSH